MLKRWQFGLLTAAAALALGLVVANMVLFQQNRSTQQTINTRQQFVQQSVQLETLYQQLVKGMAELAARGDDQLMAVLNGQGITITRNAGPAANPAPAAQPAKK